MKKLIIVSLLLAMLVCFASPALAASENLKMEDAEGRPGQTVFVVLSMEKAVKGDTVGLSYSYDKAHLKALPEQCAWNPKGALSDFDIFKNTGVWATSKAIDIGSSFCVLAFEIREDATFSETQVSGTVLIKNGATEVGEYQATATVAIVCDHQFDAWNDTGLPGHSRTCSLCEQSQLSAHEWDEGVIRQDPEDSDKQQKVITCKICGATMTEVVETQTHKPEDTQAHKPETTEPQQTQTEQSAKPGNPEKPENTEPTQTTWPTEPEYREPLVPTNPLSEETNSDQQRDNTGHDGHTHSQGEDADYDGTPSSSQQNDSMQTPTGDPGYDRVPSQQETTEPEQETEHIHEHTDSENIITITEDDEIVISTEPHVHTQEEVLTQKPKTETAVAVAGLIAVAVIVIIILKKKKII